MLEAAVGDEEGLAAALLAVGDPGQINTGLADEPAAQLDDEPGGTERCRAFGEHVPERLTHRIHIHRFFARKIGNSEPAAEIDLWRLGTGGVGDLARKGDARPLGVHIAANEDCEPG